MLHTAMRCMPPCSHTKLGKKGNAVFAYGPVALSKGDDLDCVVMSNDYAIHLERYIESLAIEPLIRERGHLPSMAPIGTSRHTGETAYAIEPALEEWTKLHANSKVLAADYCVREIDSVGAPKQVLHHPGYAFIKLTHIKEPHGGMAITVYYVFRKENTGPANTTLIGMLAGLRPAGAFDPATTGPFFTEEALRTFFEWEQKTKERYGDKITVGTAPTEAEVRTSAGKRA